MARAAFAMPLGRRRGAASATLLGATFVLGVAGGVLPALGQQPVLPRATPAVCGPGSAPETGIQGRVSLAEHESGRADEPYTCNAVRVGGIDSGAGFKVWRYTDASGQECAYYDSTLVFPFDAIDPRRDSGGVFVVDMSDPTAPALVSRLQTPAMLSPHESLVLNERRGLLAAVLGTPATFPGIVDLYDVSENCLDPQLQSSAPVGFLGHESGFSPDGNTFYAASLFNGSIAAIDVTDPTLPVPITIVNESSHGLTISADGQTAYLASLDDVDGTGGIAIMDVSSIDAREPFAQMERIGDITWPDVSIPQAAIPVTIGGTPYLVEIDEYAGNPVPVANGVPETLPGAARLIDIADPTAPEVVSDLRLEVHDLAARQGDSADDPGASFVGRGYAGHYCAVPRPVDPEIVACSMILSGLRVFDIRDPENPAEIAYYNHPGEPIAVDLSDQEHGAAYAMSAPAFAPERNEIWYSDVASGFHVVRLTNGAWNSAPAPTPGPTTAPVPTSAPTAAPTVVPTATAAPVTPAPGPSLPATGGGVALLGIATLAAGRALHRRR